MKDRYCYSTLTKVAVMIFIVFSFGSVHAQSQSESKPFLRVEGQITVSLKRFFKGDTTLHFYDFTYFSNHDKWAFMYNDQLFYNFPIDGKEPDFDSAAFQLSVQIPYLLKSHRSNYDKVFPDTLYFHKEFERNQYIDSGEVNAQIDAAGRLVYQTKMYYLGYLQYRKSVHQINSMDTVSGTIVFNQVRKYLHQVEMNDSVNGAGEQTHYDLTLSKRDTECLEEALDSQTNLSLIIYSYRGCWACSALIKGLKQFPEILQHITLANIQNSNDEIEEYQERLHMKLPVIKPYCYSPHAYPIAFLIKDGKVVHTWEGYSPEVVKQIRQSFKSMNE